ncbi:MAG: hypothetical protein CMD96_02020 [Gammaproteobacteria bacterium]|nr:hypothetical protein [Gammaproteobacteria bacterium]HJP18454.1 hypothetical protein [Nitrospinota bacterium]
MEYKIKLFHNLTGALSFIVFLGSGVYMLTKFPVIDTSNEAIKHIFKASHIYLLLASLLNMILGGYFLLNEKKVDKIFQVIGSVLIMASTFMLAFAFFHEPGNLDVGRPITGPAVVLIFLGVMFHWLSRMGQGTPEKID